MFIKNLFKTFLLLVISIANLHSSALVDVPQMWADGRYDTFISDFAKRDYQPTSQGLGACFINHLTGEASEISGETDVSGPGWFLYSRINSQKLPRDNDPVWSKREFKDCKAYTSRTGNIETILFPKMLLIREMEIGKFLPTAVHFWDAKVRVDLDMYLDRFFNASPGIPSLPIDFLESFTGEDIDYIYERIGVAAHDTSCHFIPTARYNQNDIVKKCYGLWAKIIGMAYKEITSHKTRAQRIAHFKLDIVIGIDEQNSRPKELLTDLKELICSIEPVKSGQDYKLRDKSKWALSRLLMGHGPGSNINGYNYVDFIEPNGLIEEIGRLCHSELTNTAEYNKKIAEIKSEDCSRLMNAEQAELYCICKILDDARRSVVWGG